MFEFACDLSRARSHAALRRIDEFGGYHSPDVCYGAISAYAERAMLNWVLNAVAVTRPSAWAIGLSIGTPSSTSASEIATGSGYTRQTATFPDAASPAGSCSNASAMTFGPFSTGCTVQALQVWDTVAATSGNFLWYGQLATARTLGSGDSLVINAAALTISLA